MSKARVLIVEDDPDGCRSVREAVEDMGMEAVATVTGEDGVRAFREGAFDVVLTDLVLPDINGVEVLARIRQADDQVPVLIMTAYGSVPSAVSALKAGAYDYVTKPLDLDDLQSRIARAAETRRLRTEVRELHRTLKGKYGIDSMVAVSEAMREIVGQVERLAGTNATVLVQGESGVGKEVVVRALHAESRRADGPFVAVNCGALTESLLESELFGHEKGAFTGAMALRRGAFERADGGTLFLDEIGNAPASVQVRLLRVLEEREITRVGGQSSIPVDVRLLSASNRDLEDLVQGGDFREDLLYRLNVVVIRIPPLRERRPDIRPLVERFVAAACREHGREISSIGTEYYAALEQQSWPGNVRQLHNVVESSVLMARESKLDVGDLNLPSTPRVAPEKESPPAGLTLADLEREALFNALKQHDGNRTLAAEALGISRRTIQRKIKEFDLPF